MYYEWDPWKAAANLDKHGVPFEEARNFDLGEAIIKPDDRFEYGEPRWSAIGLIGARLHILVFTLREAETLRVISLRKANSREVNFYVEAKTGLDQSG